MQCLTLCSLDCARVSKVLNAFELLANHKHGQASIPVACATALKLPDIVSPAILCKPKLNYQSLRNAIEVAASLNCCESKPVLVSSRSVVTRQEAYAQQHQQVP